MDAIHVLYGGCVSASTAQDQSALDPDLLDAVDRYVAAHTDLDRSAVIGTENGEAYGEQGA